MLLKQSKTGIYYVGQAGFIFCNTQGQLLAVDLYLSDCVEKIENTIGFKRLIPAVIKPNDICLDYIIATHPHFDHFDYDAMEQLMENGRTELFASVECEKLVSKLNINTNKVCYVKPGEIYDISGFQLEFVQCDHGISAPDAIGVIVRVDQKNVYITGDTCLRMDRVSDFIEKGPFDIIIGPINGTFGNMNEEEFARFGTAIGAKKIIPCHYGMFAFHGGNVGLFLKKMAELNNEDCLYLMTPGEWIDI